MQPPQKSFAEVEKQTNSTKRNKQFSFKIQIFSVLISVLPFGLIDFLKFYIFSITYQNCCRYHYRLIKVSYVIEYHTRCMYQLFEFLFRTYIWPLRLVRYVYLHLPRNMYIFRNKYISLRPRAPRFILWTRTTTKQVIRW